MTVGVFFLTFAGFLLVMLALTTLAVRQLRWRIRYGADPGSAPPYPGRRLGASFDGGASSDGGGHHGGGHGGHGGGHGGGGGGHGGGGGGGHGGH